MTDGGLKVGELARRTGLTVRTLHFYEEIGLVKPDRRTDGGHRLYGPVEVERLQRVTSMRQLGFTLEEIGDLLDAREGRADVVLERHIAHLRAEIARAGALAARLTALAERLPDEPGVEDLLLAIEETVMHESNLTADQVSAIERHRRELGPDGMERAWKAFTALIAEARDAQARGTSPEAPAARELGRRWLAAIDRLMPSDPGIRSASGAMLAERAEAQDRLGLTDEVRGWLHRAASAGA